MQYGLTSEEYFDEETSNSQQTAIHSITLNNLLPGTTYFYRVKWTDVDGNTGVSEEKTFATLPPPQVLEVSTTDIRTDSALVRFTVSSATSVDLLYGQSVSYGGVETVATSTTESSYSVRLANLQEDTQYNYKFILKDIDGNDYDSIENHRFSTRAFPRISSIQVQEIKNSASPTVDVTWDSNIEISSVINVAPQNDPDLTKDVLDSKLKTDHKLRLNGLNPDTKYTMIVSGTDSIGNIAESEEYEFTTATDSRPPELADIKVETRISDSDPEQAQLIVSWNTDEPSTSSVEYGEGSTGPYTQKTLVDDNLSINHVVIINNIRPSSVYHLRPVSEDANGNEGIGRNIVTISAQVSENPLDIILTRLSEVFGFLQ